MSTKLTRRKTFAVVFVALFFACQTGCQSGWKMPSTNIFPWSKKPSESMLAGSNPSLSAPSSKTGTLSSTGAGPVSPAINSTPSLLSSTNPTNTRPSPYGSAQGGNNSKIPTSSDFTVPQTNPTTGLAANANGYQTGPYSMAAARGTGHTAPSPYGGGSSLAASQPPTGFTPATGFNPATNAPTTGMMAQNAPSVSSSLPSMQPNGLPQASAQPAQQQPAMFAASGLPGLPNPQTAPQFAGLPQAGPMGLGSAAPAMVGSVPQGMANTNMASLPQPGAGFSMPNTATNGFSAAPQAMAASYSGASPYRPGSTSRSTAYDFSRQPSSSTSPIPHTAIGVPTTPQQGVFR